MGSNDNLINFKPYDNHVRYLLRLILVINKLRKLDAHVGQIYPWCYTNWPSCLRKKTENSTNIIKSQGFEKLLSDS